MKEIYLEILSQADREEIALGAKWYNQARDFAGYLSATYNLSMEQAAGVIAVLSPMVEWTLNKRAAETLCRDRSRARRIPGFGRNRRKALKIIKDNDLERVRGPKVRPFFETILNPNHNIPVVDTHIIAAGYKGEAYRDDFKWIQNSLPRIKKIQAEIQEIAQEKQWPVSQVQATIWLTFKRLNGPYADQLKLWK